MQATIDIPGDSLEATLKRMALEKLAKNVSKENLQFLAELSEKPNANDKLSKKKILIQTFF